MRGWVTLLALGLVLGALPLRAVAGQDAGPGTTDGALLVTMGQGDEIWERFGHNFLAVPDPATGRMIAYNWGVFDFAAPDFLSRFLLGDTRYWMQGDDLEAVLQVYQRFNRSITIQRLALTPAQLDTLRHHLAWNALPENRYYRYDYFRDNCSTRLRDALDLALGGELQRVTRNRLTNLTYRSETVRLTDEAPASQFGITVALGQPADVQLSAWEAMFVPMRLQEYVRDVRVAGADGAPVPLVQEERVVFEARRAPELARAPSMLAELAVAGLVLAALIAALGRAAARGAGRARGALVAIGATWGAVAGIVGVVLVLAWTATQHAFWFRNENLFHFNPLALALLVLLPLAWRRARWWPAVRMVAFGVAALSFLGAALKFMPWMMQDNWALVALALPVNLALAWAVHGIDRGTRSVPASGRARRLDERRSAAA